MLHFAVQLGTPWGEGEIAECHFPEVKTKLRRFFQSGPYLRPNTYMYTPQKHCVVKLLTFPGQASASSILFLKLSLSCSMRLWWTEIIISLFKHIWVVMRRTTNIQNKRWSILSDCIQKHTFPLLGLPLHLLLSWKTLSKPTHTKMAKCTKLIQMK